MEQQSSNHNHCVRDRVEPPPAGKYPWLVFSTTESEENNDRIFFELNKKEQQYTNSPISSKNTPHYHCKLPQLTGCMIYDCSNGYFILQPKHTPKSRFILHLSLYNPVTLDFIRLPKLNLKFKPLTTTTPDFILYDDDNDHKSDIVCCFLSTPPDFNYKVLLLVRNSKPSSIVLYVVSDASRWRKSRWTEISCGKRIKKITNVEDDVINYFVNCNAKIYAYTRSNYIVQVELVVDVKTSKVVIKFLPFVKIRDSLHCDFLRGSLHTNYVTSSSTRLFNIVCFYDALSYYMHPEDDQILRLKARSREFEYVRLFEMDFSIMEWVERVSVKDLDFFLIEAGYPTISCKAIESESGGYIHIIQDNCRLCSYNIEDKTISYSDFSCPDLQPAQWSNYYLLWVLPETRSLDDYAEDECKTDMKAHSIVSRVVGRKTDELSGENMTLSEGFGLLDIPLHLLQLIADYCVGVDYLNFRATCVSCRIAAPMIQWRSETALKKLQTHSLLSPWLMMYDKDRSIFTFTDPMLGDRYFMTTTPELTEDTVICSCRYGWLLLRIGSADLIFFNPFTRAIIRIPGLDLICSGYDFSASPTSPTCTIVAFTTLILFTSPGKEWRMIRQSVDYPYNLLLSENYNQAFCGQNLYVLHGDGKLEIARFGSDCSRETLVAEAPKSSSATCLHRFIVECNDDLLLVVIGEFGESVEVYKLNHPTQQWEKINGIGKYTIYCWGMDSFSVVAKLHEMENMIYFPRFRGKNIVSYSFETAKYHTFGCEGKDEFTNFFSTREQLSSFWVEPTWSF